jgi:sulfhydrogenase subunit beta (sulfur reductase)
MNPGPDPEPQPEPEPEPSVGGGADDQDFRPWLRCVIGLILDHVGSARRLDPRAGLGALVDTLNAAGYRVVGPVVRDDVIVYDDVSSERQLPEGVTVDQAPGRWRLHRDDHDLRRFSWTPGADSVKRYVFPARSEVLTVRRADGSFIVSHPAPPDRPIAVIGMRDCEVRALGVIDTVFTGGEHPDPRYAERRSGLFVVAVTCGVPSSTCWCTAMGGGPQPRSFDLRLTEIDGALLVEAGTDRGRDVLDLLPGPDAVPADLDAADRVVAAALDMLPVPHDGAPLPERLAGTDHHPHWDEVAARCLSCGNCTSVCPTCFCSSFSDRTALGANGDAETVREQSWVSCFQLDHSNLGGRPVRATTASRYRQWLTHKLQTWPDQFGTDGCVGCGRCTTWCPAGIDLPVEAAALAGGSS